MKFAMKNPATPKVQSQKPIPTALSFCLMLLAIAALLSVIIIAATLVETRPKIALPASVEFDYAKIIIDGHEYTCFHGIKFIHDPALCDACKNIIPRIR